MAQDRAPKQKGRAHASAARPIDLICWVTSLVVLYLASTRSRFASRPIPEADGFPDFPTFVPVFLSLLGTALDVFDVMPMVLDHFHDLFVGLSHVHSASLRDLT